MISRQRHREKTKELVEEIVRISVEDVYFFQKTTLQELFLVPPF